MKSVIRSLARKGQSVLPRPAEIDDIEVIVDKFTALEVCFCWKGLEHVSQPERVGLFFFVFGSEFQRSKILYPGAEAVCLPGSRSISAAGSITVSGIYRLFEESQPGLRCQCEPHTLRQFENRRKLQVLSSILLLTQNFQCVTGQCIKFLLPVGGIVMALSG